MTFGHVIPKITNSHGYIEVLKRNTRVPVDRRVFSGNEWYRLPRFGYGNLHKDRILLAISMPITNFHRTYFLIRP